MIFEAENSRARERERERIGLEGKEICISNFFNFMVAGNAYPLFLERDYAEPRDKTFRQSFAMELAV